MSRATSIPNRHFSAEVYERARRPLTSPDLDLTPEVSGTLAPRENSHNCWRMLMRPAVPRRAARRRKTRFASFEAAHLGITDWHGPWVTTRSSLGDAPIGRLRKPFDFFCRRRHRRQLRANRQHRYNSGYLQVLSVLAFLSAATTFNLQWAFTWYWTKTSLTDKY